MTDAAPGDRHPTSGHEAPARTAWWPGPWVVVAAGLVLVALVAGLVQVVRLDHEGDRRAEELGRLDAVYEQTLQENADLAAEREALLTRAEAVELASYLWRGEAAEALDTRDQLVLDSFLTSVATQDLEGALATVDAAISFRGAAANDLATCLSGLQDAYGGLSDGDDRAAIAALQEVADVCRRAESAVTEGEVSHAFFFDFADPAVIYDGSTYWAYSTNGAGGDVQLIRSTDLSSWEWVGTAMSELPRWAAPHRFWAPGVFRSGGQWLLYYTGQNAATGQQCIGVGVATGPRGPFADPLTEPLVCQYFRGGSIDPSPFVGADGRPYLTWKAEGETVGGVSTIWVQELAPSGTELIGEPTQILRADRAWEDGIVEGPSMHFVGGTYHLLYSGNRWDTERYAVGHAVCDSPRGPCRKDATPAMASDGARTGPGGAELFVGAGGTLHVAYHAWVGEEVGYPHRRTLRIRPVQVSGSSLSF